MLRDADIDPAPLAGKRVAILGYGNQGRAQALNLNDSGIDVVVGLRDGSASAARVAADGLAHRLARARPRRRRRRRHAARARRDAGRDLPRRSSRIFAQGAALGFSHGLAIRFGFIVPRPDLDVFMVAPKGPGTALRSLYRRRARAWSRCTRSRRMPAARPRRSRWPMAARSAAAAPACCASTFAEECEADLFNEQAVVWGAVPEILIAGFDTLVEAGVSEEVAYMECVGELKLIAELIEARGIAGDARGDQQHRRAWRGDSAARASSTSACAREMRDILAEDPQRRVRATAERRGSVAAIRGLRAARETARGSAVEQARNAARPDSATSRSCRRLARLAFADRGALGIGALQPAVRRRRRRIGGLQAPARPLRPRGCA